MDIRRPDRNDLRFLAAVLLGGLFLRLVWLHMLGLTGFEGAGEATRVALAIATHGTIGDAYWQGYGPTAHLLPTSPAAAGLLMWLFGPYSAAATVALLAWSLVQVGAAFLLLRWLYARLGTDPAALRWGVALLCLLTPFVPQETIDFRYWEGALALALAALNLGLIAGHLGGRAFRRRDMALAAGLSAFTFFVCPPVGLAVDMCWAMFALGQLGVARALRFALTSAAALALLVVPWAIRNDAVLGSPVWLRSNLGLELAIANHADALSNRPPENVFADRLKAIHPYQEGPARAALKQAGGEVAYSRALGAQAWHWIAAHPAGFARLSIRHLREFFFPQAWQMYFTGWEGLRAPRALAISLVNLLGLLGLALGLAERRRGYAMIAVYVAIVALPYAFLQPMSRYIYLAYGVLAFPAVELLLRLGRGALSLRSRPEPAGRDRQAA